MIFLHACPVSCVEMSDLNVCVGVGGCSSRWQDSLVAAMWSVSRAMLAEDVFNVRRNAYWWAWTYAIKVAWYGDSEGTAVWCAVKYVDHLVGKILRRKARVSAATLQQQGATASANEPPPGPHVPQQDRPSAPKDPGCFVRLINAVSGEPCRTVTMSKWMVLGDAIAKANSQNDQTRKILRGVQPDGTPGDEADRWYFAAHDEVFVRGRIFQHLEPDQDLIEVRVIKVPKPIITTGWRPPQDAVRPEQVLTQRENM